MDFPITELMDEDACYERIVELLHPEGLACPRCGARAGLKVHRRHRAPVLDYRCTTCRRVFNAFTGTAFHKTHRRPSEIVLILRGIAQGVPTAQMARELKRNRPHLLALRHRLQESAARARPREPLSDPVVEADEMYQDAGEKRHPAPGPRRPAAAAGQQTAGPRHVRQRPASGRRGGRSSIWADATAGRGACGSGDAGAAGGRLDVPGGDGPHRRVVGL